MSYLSFFLDFLFPKRCVNCGKLGVYLCLQCQFIIKPVILPICPMCERQAVDGVTHPGCQTRYSLDGLISFFRYDGAVKAAIKRLKYKPYLSELAKILLPPALNGRENKESRGFAGFVVVPVPLHPRRQRERGFNQADLIGKAVAEKLGLQFVDGALKRIRNTKPQVELKGKERRENILNAFIISPNILISQYPNILLVDDVWTTGSTLRTCGNLLKRAGAKKVWTMTLAR
ncbi:ComF family protein [Candidatus Microgenomates bacterium]|nr:ComF family protein [Candidatus Microgenomates bacterium]